MQNQEYESRDFVSVDSFPLFFLVSAYREAMECGSQLKGDKKPHPPLNSKRITISPMPSMCLSVRKIVGVRLECGIMITCLIANECQNHRQLNHLFPSKSTSKTSAINPPYTKFKRIQHWRTGTVADKQLDIR